MREGLQVSYVSVCPWLHAPFPRLGWFLRDLCKRWESGVWEGPQVKGEVRLVTNCLVTQCGQGRVHWPGPTEPKLGSSVTMGWEHESGQSHFQHDVIWLVLKGPRISIYTMYYMYYTQSFCFDYLNSFLCFGALPLLSCLERGVALSSPRLNQKLDAGLGSGSMGRPRQWVVGGWGVGWGGSWGGDRKWTSVCCWIPLQHTQADTQPPLLPWGPVS